MRSKGNEKYQTNHVWFGCLDWGLIQGSEIIQMKFTFPWKKVAGALRTHSISHEIAFI